MKATGTQRLALWAGCALVLAGRLGNAFAAGETAGEKQPLNVVLILVDDLGWTDLGCQGSKYFETPQLDRLARQGMRFTDGYAACAVCSPTRAAVQTGRYPARVGVTDWIRSKFQGGIIGPDGKNPAGYVGAPSKPLLCPRNPLFMELDELTLAEALGPAGYVTCHIGKWHLGQQDQFPEKQGYDENFGGCDLGQPPNYFDPYESKRQFYEIPNLPPRKPGEYLTDREADEAVGFIRRNKDRPFFLNMCHYCVHTPLQGKKEVVAKYNAKPKTNQKNPVYAAMVESVDDAAGRILAALDDLDLADRTVVIFTSDNGGLLGPTDNAPLRSGKGFPYEGGIRVPLIVRWPGVVEPGTTCGVPASSVDFFPTLLEIAGVPLPAGRAIDGESLVPLLKQTGTLSRSDLFWHFPHYRFARGPYSIIRSGDWKLIKWYQEDGFELFNLADDLGETKDLAPEMPDRVRQLDAKLSAWLESCGAKVPKPNPDYEPKPKAGQKPQRGAKPQPGPKPQRGAKPGKKVAAPRAVAGLTPRAVAGLPTEPPAPCAVAGLLTEPPARPEVSKSAGDLRSDPRRGRETLAERVVRAESVSGVEGVKRPNVLWIIAEDLSPDLGCYGNRQVFTPNLDRLARQGVRYTKAFTTAPVCSASRSAFMTGMYQTTIGAHNHRSHRGDGYLLPEGVRVFTGWLREAGYYTANLRRVGKEIRGTGKTDWNFKPDEKPYDFDNWDDLAPHQPFYAQINFSETHRGFKHCPEHPVDPERVDLPPYYPDHPVARADWALYLETVNVLDQKVGKVLARLEADGLADDTVVIFFGDHGQAMVRGKQWCYESGLRVPLIVRWAKNFPAPPGFRPGTASDQLVAAIDFSATTLAIAGAKRPANMQGRVFLGPEADPPRQYVFGARDRCDETVFRIRTVRDARYRYIRNFMPQRPFLQINRYKEASYPMIRLMRRLHAEGKLTPEQAVLLAASRPAEELYDLETDPYEVKNLAESPKHEEVLKRMRAALEAWIDESDDQGRTAEPPEIVQFWEEKMKRTYDARLKKLQQQP